VGAFGLKGQLKVDSLTDFLERFEPGARLLLRGEWVEVEAMSIHKGRPLLKLRGVDNITAAEKLQWEYLEALGRPELDEDEFLAEDLVGLKVMTEAGEELGVVDEVLPYPAQDILKVGEIMIPLVKEFVKNIDEPSGTITVHLIPGMRPGEDS
jgi:16S rRNA processing protein RimM